MKLITRKQLNDMSLEELEKLEDEIYIFWRRIKTIVEYKKMFK